MTAATGAEELTHDELAALRDAVYDALEARGAMLTAAEARRLAEWFRIRAEHLFTRDLHRQAREARRNEQRFAVALRHSEVVVFESDVEGRLTWLYNSQLEERVGSMIGRRLNELMSPEESAALDAAERVVRETDTRASLVSRVTIGTTTVDMLQSFEALHDAAGVVIGITGTAINITEATRTRERLSQAVAFQEQMIGILGHDLMNPVSAVQSITRLLQADPAVVAAAGPALAQVARATRRMAEMIRVIVDVTRTRVYGSLPIARTDMDLGLLCAEVVDELRAAHPARAIAIEARGDLHGAWDHARMGQVVSNLVGNALKHGERDAPVTVTLDGEASIVTLAVVNRGAMITAEGVDRLFDPFTQGPDAATRRTGLGLGLYIVKQIVTAHDGTISAASDAGTTRLVVCVPRCAYTAGG